MTNRWDREELETKLIHGLPKFVHHGEFTRLGYWLRWKCVSSDFRSDEWLEFPYDHLYEFFETVEARFSFDYLSQGMRIAFESRQDALMYRLTFPTR